jgi:raffinose/stachyose/melibiose transport system substrate-binding protein
LAAGNWLSHIASRVVGEDVYDATLSGEGKFSTPEWEQAFGYIEELAAHDCVNESVNAVDDNAGAQLFFQGQAAMHPIGSWLVSWAIDENPDLDFDFVNLPAMPEGSAGTQDSVIGVSTGHMVNPNSENIDLAIEFLALVNSPENVLAFINEAELSPLAESASAADVDERTARLTGLLKTGAPVVLPPDTGYDVEMALQLYEAEAAVLGGQSTPAEALATLDERLGR